MGGYHLPEPRAFPAGHILVTLKQLLAFLSLLAYWQLAGLAYIFGCN